MQMYNEVYRTSIEQKFQDVLPHFWSTPFYHDKLTRAGVKREKLGTLTDLQTVPFTTKEDLRTSPPLLRTPFSIEHLEYIFSSSGTTGTPTAYFWTQEDSQVLRMASIEALGKVGIAKNDVALIVAPLGMPIMGYCMTQQYNALGAGVIPLGIRPPHETIDTIHAFPVTIIASLPVVATRLFEYASGHGGVQHENRSLRHIHCGGDFLSEARRQRIQATWNVSCYNFFGMSEIFGPIAGECEQHNGMHFSTEMFLVEVLDPITKTPVDPGQPGIAVYTTLWAKGTPLLRYWSNDYVTIDSSPCDCGCVAPRIHYFGRPNDMAIVGGRRLFAKELEEEVLAYPIGNEYQLILLGGSQAQLVVEEIAGLDIPVHNLQQDLSAFLGISVTIKVEPSGTLPRTQVKPKRIEDHRVG